LYASSCSNAFAHVKGVIGDLFCKSFSVHIKVRQDQVQVRSTGPAKRLNKISCFVLKSVDVMTLDGPLPFGEVHMLVTSSFDGEPDDQKTIRPWGREWRSLPLMATG
jgi:hypothetical protein